MIYKTIKELYMYILLLQYSLTLQYVTALFRISHTFINGLSLSDEKHLAYIMIS